MDIQKTCSLCGEIKSVTEFYVHNQTGRVRNPCKACAAERTKKWKAENPEKVRVSVRESTRRRRADPAKLALEREQERRRRHKGPQAITTECSRCGSEFTYIRTTQRRLLCDECKRSDWAFKKYGLSAAELADLRAAHAGRCGICATHRPGGKSNTEFHIDHDHGTGAIRGLLCAACNTAIGLFQNNPTHLRAAADYLERHRI